MHSITNLKYRVPKKITIVFHNGSNYDYHCITKQLPEEPKEQFTCLGEKTENIKYGILQSIDSTRFMASSLSDLVNNQLNVNTHIMTLNFQTYLKKILKRFYLASIPAKQLEYTKY